jgi:hypothetical protein
MGEPLSKSQFAAIKVEEDIRRLGLEQVKQSDLEAVAPWEGVKVLLIGSNTRPWNQWYSADGGQPQKMLVFLVGFRPPNIVEQRGVDVFTQDLEAELNKMRKEIQPLV